MRRSTFILLLLLPLSGCHLPGVRGVEDPQEPARPLPEILVHGRPLRGAILNPIPPRYDIDSDAGCVVEDEFRVELTELAIDVDGRLRMAGRILNADPNRQPPMVATVFTRSGDVALRSQVALQGRLDVTVDLDAGTVLVLDMIGFRALELDLVTLVRAARSGRAS